MPTYDYVCGGCHAEFEEFQSITASPLRKCPHCGKLKLKRLIGTGAGIIFKGSGFYETDYRSDSYKSGAKADTQTTTAKSDGAAKTGSTAAAGASTAKSDSAPAQADAPSKGASAAKKSSPVKSTK
jgi:putative FmdB family regulatory protein